MSLASGRVIVFGLVGVALSILGLSISFIGLAIIQAAVTNSPINVYVFLGPFVALVGVLVTLVSALTGKTT